MCPSCAAACSTAALLVFVDVMKELPATLVMRPFNFDTLATRPHAGLRRTPDRSLHGRPGDRRGGLLPLIALSRQISRARNPQ